MQRVVCALRSRMGPGGVNLSWLTHPARNVSNASDRAGHSPEPALPETRQPDVLHRTATEIVWPASSRQEKFAAKVHRVLSEVLMHDATLRQTLVERYGFSIEEVRASPDLMKAFLRWDSMTGSPREAARELRRRKGRLRSAVARGMGVRHVPDLIFRNGQQSDDETRLQGLLDEIEAGDGVER